MDHPYVGPSSTPVGREVLGTVKWFKDEKGYGRITGDDGYVYFAHFSGILANGNSYRSLSEGQRVRFRVSGNTGDHGRSAADHIEVLDA